MLPANLAIPFSGPRDASANTRDRIDALSQQLSSGRQSDLGRAVGSDFSEVSHLSFKMRDLATVRDSLSLAQAWTDGIQSALEAVSEANDRTLAAIPSSLSPPSQASISRLSDVADGVLDDIGTAMSGSIGGRYLFANGDVNAPISDMEAVRSDIASIAQNSTDFGTYLADVTAYFDAGGAFETTIVSSYASEQATFPGRDGKSFGVDLDARSAGLKEAIANAAVLSGMRHVGFDVSELVKSSAASMLLTRASAADADVSTMQAQVGVLEERISDDREAAVSERLDAEKRLSDLVGIDEYDVATRLNAELSRLEAAYAITARRSQLRLTNFL
ncbi:hypothetical protein JANAI62_34410 [Jannaschia pagri]|uniref:Flagellin n=2 Tax=Jannaschia TaxID=188905 RepID=A0ABQ4NQX9_9RHOB|nr:flagellin [Jannaschia sp. AI_62]GIT92983.1 hypothetical protein JANAI61_34410 [Jannaschia sp. AI_61]GIT96818.1 hypothetical protein JANAI62_34410 [Jannaschia sp. AI_62]